MNQHGSTNQDLEHLRLLSIFHYVVAGLVALFGCMPLIHFGLGLAIAMGAFEGEPAEGRFVGVILMAIAGVIILAGWGLAAAIFFAGRNLARRQSYTYCLVVAGISCIFMPFGTVLGVFTIIVLMRESVKPLFRGSGAPTPAGPAQA